MLMFPPIDPVAIDLGFIKIHWYGMMYLFGFGCTYLIFRHRAKLGRAPFTVEQVDDVVFVSALSVVIGGRAGYVFFYGMDQFLQNPLWLFYVWKGGMSFHGGLIGVGIGLAWYAKRHRFSVIEMFDLAALAAPIGLFFGRIGNFIGQELWGRPTDVPWGMLFPRDPLQVARHPSQLYEAALEGLVLFAVLYWYNTKPRPIGSSMGIFLLGYGVFRFVIEFFREPDSHIGLDAFALFSRGQLLSTPMIIAGFVLLLMAIKRNQMPAGATAAKRRK